MAEHIQIPRGNSTPDWSRQFERRDGMNGGLSEPRALPSPRLLPLWQVPLWQAVPVHLLWQQ